ncbi:MAG TPA: GNAT family N-acetyltransferase [Myxococcales bacterium]|jgi:hypothetical protein
MAHPEYARLFARPCDRVVCAVGEGGGATILFPLLLRPLAAEPWAREGEPRWDAITPYGYGGPFAFGEILRDDSGFWRAYGEWCRDERIVSTFARLSVFPEQLASIPGRVEVRAQNVVVPLGGGGDAVWQRYRSKVRRWVRIAQEAGLSVERDGEGARLDEFMRIYQYTMERHHAEDWYYFPRSFFQAIVDRLRGHYAFFYALDAGRVVSTDLVLCSSEHIYYFLGGTLRDLPDLGPNYLLKHAIATWAAAEGKRWYVLGGGYEPDDGIFRYKHAFAPRGVVPFRVACLTHDEDACLALGEDRAAAARRAEKPWLPRRDFFPPYRA